MSTAQLFTVRLQSGVQFQGHITLPRQFPGGGHLVHSMEQVDKLLSVKCPPAFLRIETLENGERVPHIIATASIESIVPYTGSPENPLESRQAMALA